MVDIPGDSSTTATISVGGSTSDSLEVVGDHDWFKITLTAGQSIQVALDGITLEDPYLRIYDSNGNLLYENDDTIPGTDRDSLLAFTATYTGTYYIDVGAWNEDYAGTYQLSVSTYTPPPLGTVEELADQLTDGYWGGDRHHFDVTQGGSLTVNITALTSAGQNLARQALSLWSDIIGVDFVEVSSGGQITFDDNEEGAFSDGVWSGGIITSAHVNVSTQWLADYGTDLTGYSFQTYVHEIGHALGLGHQGNYNGDARYPFEALYQNDGWPMSIMSYFDQVDNTYFAGQGFDFNFALTPMMADILAMQQLYGLSTTTRSGDTTYGAGWDANMGAICIFDSGGIDEIASAGLGGDQLINLNPGTFSNIGEVGNVSIALGVTIENASSGTGNDTLIGNDVDNWLFSGDGNDTLSGGAGNDTLLGGWGNDSIDGGTGTDTADFSDHPDFVSANLTTGTSTSGGGGGTDTLISIENLSGTLYNDTLVGDGGANVIIGSFGYDSINGAGGNDILNGGPGNDTLDGGSGIDMASYVDATSAVTVSLSTSSAQNTGGAGTDTLTSIEQLEGSAYGDKLTGNGSANILYGLAGNDTLNGGSGADQLFGGLGNDIFIVDNVGDVVTEEAGEGTDEVRTALAWTLGANLENLRLTGANAVDGTGNGLANFLRGNDAANGLWGLDGADYLYGFDGNDALDGGEGDDRLFGGLGNDSLTGGLGYDRMYGGVGDDIYYVNDTTDYAYEYAGEGQDTVIASIDHQLRAEVEDLELAGAALIGRGHAGDNGITGNELANKLYGYGGNDALDGGNGDDRLFGAEGNDTLTGGLGYDRMYGGVGDDIYYVNDTTDYAYEYAGEGYDTVRSSVSHVLRDHIERLDLQGSSNLNGYGNAADNKIFGNAGANNLFGRDGNDKLYGQDGADVLKGENGDDWLEGGAGRDRFYGGAGADDFVFRDGDFAGLTSSTCDQIHDFSQLDGDRVRLNVADANTGLDGDQAFAFIGNAAFSGTAGELRTYQVNGNTYVQGDTDGDAAADFMIRLDGLHSLAGSDFVL